LAGPWRSVALPGRARGTLAKKNSNCQKWGVGFDDCRARFFRGRPRRRDAAQSRSRAPRLGLAGPWRSVALPGRARGTLAKKNSNCQKWGVGFDDCRARFFRGRKIACDRDGAD